jgi:dihydroxyacetone kinase
MATKHFFPDTSSLVVRGLESLVAKNPHLALDAANKVVYLPAHSTSKVSVLSGGGAGHEPAWCGYVGQGLLSAAISGEVFASPSTKQIMAAVEKVPSEKGVILCITNYTGDNLHFGLAREKVAGSGRKVGMLRMTDDVGLGREKTSKLGRRGLAGNMFGEFRNTREREREGMVADKKSVLKLCGAAAEADYDFDTCFAIGESVNGHCVTIGSSLDYCHIPGRTHHESLPENILSVAQGIHNEAVSWLSPDTRHN